jgi:Cdc6-like AAA superfamily ATPase
MLRSHLSDGALAAAKAYAHRDVQARHVGYAISRYFREDPEVVPLRDAARRALEPRGTAHEVPTWTAEATALIQSITSRVEAIAALRAMLGQDSSPGGAKRDEMGPGPSTGVEESPKAAAPEPKPQETIADILADLDALVGLDKVKEQVRSVIAVLRANEERAKAALPTVNPGLHLVFTGAPGTGKTTVARLIARLYAAVGALPGSNFTEVDRSDLVAGYVGQTAIKTAAVVKKTVPGVLFVDEAYALTPTHGSDFGAEAIATLVKAMEDHREELSVIVAGYGDEMADFVESNPGLRSRLRTFIDFPDYKPDELVRIFDGFAKASGLHLSKEALDRARVFFERAVSRADFGNARFARTLFEQAYARMALRAAEDARVHVDELMELAPEDLEWIELGVDVQKRRIGFDDSAPRDVPKEAP